MKVRAFIFEDDHFLREFLRRFLEARGYEVFTFAYPTNCEACPCRPNHVCADIILSDVKMPQLTGIAFMEHLHQQGCKITNTALMSGEWSDSDLHRAQALGCRIFTKPFNMEKIDRWLDECETRIDPTRLLDNFSQKEWNRQKP